MGLWDALRGRSTPKRANLDALFGVPSAALNLEAGLDLRATGSGSVCYRAAQGQASRLSQEEAAGLIGSEGGPPVETVVDQYNFTWLTVRTDPPDTATLVTNLHAVNSALESQGFSTSLLCSTITFADRSGSGGAPVHLVYLYKQGTFYPFAPTGDSSATGSRERQVRDAVGADLPVESDVSRWMPLWGMPS